MSQIKLSGNPSGTGTLTIASPNTNSDYTLNLPASSGTVLADGASQSPTFNGVTATTLTVNSNNISAVNSLGFRNRIINGDMRIDQRNAGASVTIPASAYTYTLDRWAGYATQASKFTVQRNAGSVTPPAGFTNYLGATVGASANVTVGSSDLFILQQSIEGFNIADLGWGAAGATPITVSFWVRSSLTGVFGGAINTNFGANAYPFTYTINSANTWEQKTISIVGPTTGGTTDWPVNNTQGLRLNFSLGAGSTLLGTAGVWNANDRFSATGATNLIATNGATFYITGVQLEAGSVATPFERRDYGRELILCKRYYESMDWLQNSGSASNRPFYQWTLYYQVAKRAAPTMTTDGGTFDTSAGGVTATIDAITTNHFRTYPSNTQVWSSVSYTWYANAEL